MNSNNNLPNVSITNIARDKRPDITPVGNEMGQNNGVLVIYSGGTIGSMPKDPNDPDSPMIVAKWPEFRESVPALNEIPFRIDAISFEVPLDSSNIGPQHWVAMAKIIGDQVNYNAYEGFVIIHGTDTMVYTASMLSFMLQNLDKPVIITGSQIPIIKKLRNDALQNLVTALLIANPRYSNKPVVKEVCIFFRDKLLRGNRTRKMDASGYLAFHTPNYPVLGTAGDDIDIEEKFLLRPTGQFILLFDLNRDVIMMDLFPGFQDRSNIRDLIFDPDIVNAVILKTYGTGNVPTEEPEVLFSLEAKEYANLAEELKSEIPGKGIELKQELKAVFEKHNCLLSENARVFKIDKTTWEVSDRKEIIKDKRYKIAFEEDKLYFFPFGFLDDIRMSVKRGQYIVNVTQCVFGSVEQGLYDTSAVLTDCGVLSGQEITPEAALCKMMVILGQAKINHWGKEQIIPMINENIAGEQNFSICTTTLETGACETGKSHFWYRIPGTPIEGRFEIGQQSNIARAILRFKNALVKRDPEFLFNLPPDLEEELNQGKKDKLLAKFKDNKCKLSKNLELSKTNEQTWRLTNGINLYLIENEKKKLNVYEDEKPLDIKIYIDLSPNPAEFQFNMCFAGKFKKQQNKTKQSITFDVTQAAKQLLQRNSSFTIIIEDQGGEFQFDGAELSLFLK